MLGELLDPLIADVGEETINFSQIPNFDQDIFRPMSFKISSSQGLNLITF